MKTPRLALGRTLAAAASLLVALVAPGPAPARADVAAPPATQGLDVVEHLNEPVPLDGVFTDASGRPVRLRQLVARGERPTILTLVYYGCPNLCGLMLSGLVEGLKETGLALGRDYDIVTLSFNPRDTADLAGERQARFLQSIGAPTATASWHFLVGSPEPVRAVADAVGFPYRWDADSAQYAHVAVVMLLTPDGRVARYLYGVRFAPRDLKLALVEAGRGRVGTTLDRALLLCFHYDPAARRYGFFITNFLRIGALLVLAALTTLLWVLWRRELRQGRGERTA